MAECVTGTSSSEERELLPLPGAKSKVWKYFGFKQDEKGRKLNNKEVFCRICKRDSPIVETRRIYFTTCVHAMKRDYRTIAPAVPGSNKDSQNQTTLTSYVANAQPYPRTSAHFKTCEDSLLTLICKDMLPLSLVDSPNFKEFVSILDKRYKPSSRTHFTRVLLPQKYDLVKQLVKKKLHNEAKHCALTTDLWTGCHNRGYLSLTVHFIDSRMELNYYCLMTKEVSESHTADVIGSVLSESFQEWELREPEQVYAFCTDNGKNIVNAIINHLKCFICLVLVTHFS